ncbi:hypothetical protein LQE92_12635 [Lacrimispora sp. NSJ-141]|uniref:Tetratricopeptide repeat protein n=1 Tax=Lientehia hominis TaxID=2897778 RepID=A0AAP2RK25_9FIRM|nr:hypothetical protein [Lientehia hominis]MCD2493462.1 hypothetical protein [Lientehia hominis]
MDKYELSIKEDKIKKHAEKKDYVTAAKIADTIDWRRVKNIKMLTLVSQIYEKVKNYAEAKNVLLIAYERVPVGRRMLYKLTELCVKSGNLDEAEDFFEEFQEIAPNDISKLILAYQIESSRGEPLEKLITILELYRKNEFEEKWAYELAYLYHKAGRSKDCVQLCNEIILWFSVGPYVDKALELKMQYEPLTPSQQEKLVNKKKFEERIKAVEREFEEKYSQETLDSGLLGEEPTLKDEGLKEAAMTDEPEATEEASVDEEVGITSDVLLQNAQFQDMEADLAQSVRAAAEEMPQAEETAGQDTKEILAQTKELKSSKPEITQTTEFLNEVSAALAASVFADSEQEDEAEEMDLEIPEEEADKKIDAEVVEEEPKAAEETPAEDAAEEKDEAGKIPDAESSESEENGQNEEIPAEDKADEMIPETKAVDADSAAEDEGQEEDKAPAEADEKAEEVFETPEEELEEEEIDEKQITCVVVEEEPGEGRIPLAVEKLKKTHEILGVPATQVAKISGAKLSAKGIHNTFTRLAGRDLIVDNAADLTGSAVKELVRELKKPFVSMVLVLVDSPERIDKLLVQNLELDKLCVYLEDEEQMSVDDFVTSVNAYAEEEECIIDEMAGLAIYALAERMRNDGIPLSEQEAKALVDEAIDKAEHRGLKGLFGSKYDKKGYLILKEQYFKNL